MVLWIKKQVPPNPDLHEMSCLERQHQLPYQWLRIISQTKKKKKYGLAIQRDLSFFPTLLPSEFIFYEL